MKLSIKTSLSGLLILSFFNANASLIDKIAKFGMCMNDEPAASIDNQRLQEELSNTQTNLKQELDKNKSLEQETKKIKEENNRLIMMNATLSNEKNKLETDKTKAAQGYQEIIEELKKEQKENDSFYKKTAFLIALCAGIIGAVSGYASK